MVELIAITSGDLTARIDPLGAELWSLADRNGREYMTDADPAFWTGRAPLLFPIVGALNGGTYRLGAESYLLPKHGFARTKRFQCTAAQQDQVRFRLTDDKQTRAAYPFAFSLDVTFRLVGPTLHMTAAVSNRGGEPMPFSFGFHPAFAWPLPGGAAKGDHRIVFAEAEPSPIRRIDGPTGLLLPDRQPSPVAGRELALDAALFEPDALIWDRLSSRSLAYGAPGGAWLDVTFSDLPMLGIWQKPGAAFVCIEPWQGIADPLGYDGDFRDKPGVVLLPPRAERGFHMDVTVRPA